YGRFCKDVVLRPVRLLTPDLSPARLARDVLGLDGLTFLSRAEGLEFLDGLGDGRREDAPPLPANVSRKRKGLDVPALPITLLGHFLTADFCRIHGRDFLAGLQASNRKPRRRVGLRCRRRIQFVEEGSGRTDPVLEYLRCGDSFYAVRVGTCDTMLPF